MEDFEVCVFRFAPGYFVARVIPMENDVSNPLGVKGLSGLEASRNGQGAKESNGLGSRKRMEGGRASSYA